jgi:hypothetical protein
MSRHTPNKNHRMVGRSIKPSAIQYPVINTINPPIIFKMVPPLILVMPVGKDSILGPLAGALGVFRQ